MGRQGNFVLGFGSRTVGTELGVASLVKSFATLASTMLTDTVQINTAAAELTQEFRGEDHTGHVTNRNKVDLSTPSEFPQPVVVVLLVEQGRHWEFERIASFNIHLRCEARSFDHPRKGQATHFLVVVKVSVLAPLFVEINAVFLDGQC